MPGKKDQRPFLETSGTYKFQIKHFSGKSIVWFETETRRGCLLDGVTFLLHLSRAALSHIVKNLQMSQGRVPRLTSSCI